MEAKKKCPLCEGSGINPAGSEYGVCPGCKSDEVLKGLTGIPEIDLQALDKYTLENGIEVYTQKFTKFND